MSTGKYIAQLGLNVGTECLSVGAGVLRSERQSLRKGEGVFSPFWGVNSSFKLDRVHIQST